MGQLTDKGIKAIIKSGDEGRFADGDGLYLCIRSAGKAYWALRYTANGKRKLFTIGYYEHISLAGARTEAGLLRARIAKDGTDPVAERHREKQKAIRTTDDLFDDWYSQHAKRLKHPKIPLRKYERDIQPVLGGLKVEAVTPRDVRAVVHKITASKRPTVANDALALMKQLFNHGIKLDAMASNPAAAFTNQDAGGVEKSRERILELPELKALFAALRSRPDAFTRENYLACALLLVLGVRKMELLAAQWSEFDLEKGLWSLSAERTKMDAAVLIPLPPAAVAWLEELKVRACGSDYVFPRRRASKRYPHMSPDTLNAALNKLAKAGVISHFTVHDLRRSCRSLLARVGTPPHIAERCLNHKIKGVEGVYDRYDYLDERRTALTAVADIAAPITNLDV
ncbi:site-specific integrase [Motiliproteus sp. SC1-56]|uniref:tyrosine-type recombinase/integrase n=1 Tax=Motiliproteus sp. SC1-56 TaxID=2799565 RepID=UPI001A8EC5FF|nr:site-specific integrase [Motiliproteus sp. SC1-56]